VALKNTARGYIAPEKWDQGINALLMNHSFSGSNSKDQSGKSSSNFLGLNGGVNVGLRYRDYSTFNRNTSSNGQTSTEWEHVSGFIERTIISM
jgi:outer membrane usher protein